MAGGVAAPDVVARAATVRACRADFTRAARTFWIVPEIIPAATRDDVSLLYCLCRRLDDAVDEAPDVDRARLALARWRAELAGAAAPRPLVSGFLEAAARRRLPLQHLGALLDGMESDLGAVRFAGDDALVQYAYRVSASVGLLFTHLLGWRGRDAERRIVDLGVAAQISNILFGVRDDARRDRVYLPAVRLAAVGLRAEDVIDDPHDGRLLPVLEGIARLADRYYESGTRAAALAPLRYRHGMLLFCSIYRELGWRAARGLPAPRSFADVPLGLKAAHLAGLLVSAWHPRTLGLVAAPPHEPELHRAIAGWPGT
jgi:phytoene synthase